MVARPDEQAEQLLVSIKRAAELCEVSYWTIWRMADAGELPSVKIGRSRRIPYKALQRLIPEHQQG